jgi:hypothetical protein
MSFAICEVPVERMLASQSALSREKVAWEVPGLYHFTGAVEHVAAEKQIIRQHRKLILQFFIIFYLYNEKKKANCNGFISRISIKLSV